ncbi:hypothetical protein SAMN02745124_00006 [Desulfofustis glycolicus DSM 9705]|uniref:Uncharacterized protein n=2 Tax=Desulfofustis glycolicus TaxID=51195 RepID=A0A1M5RVF1_9BACT|nr:hypothetical protein SAMN02745124_00006 [Desulfofustis glycolicus DSM 9705]
MKRPIKLFESITNEQIKKLHSAPFPGGEAGVYALVSELIGIASITALSKQEAIFLIDRLQGKTERRFPARPRFSNEIEGDTSSLPSFYHVRDIRLLFKDLGWDKQRIKNWLRKYRKVKDIRSLDREQARATYHILTRMVEGRNERDATSQGKGPKQ